MKPDDKEVTEGMRQVVERLAVARWIDRSLVSEPRLDVRFSAIGREKLRQLDSLLSEIGWPESQTETLALFGLCQQARREPPKQP